MTLSTATTSTCPSILGETHSATGSNVCTSRQVAAADSSLETTLLLFHTMGNRIPNILLDRATRPQRRINMRGELYEITPQYAGVDENLARLLDGTKLKHIIDHLSSLSLITLQDTAYVCQDETSRILVEQSKHYWIHQAFMLCCYVFPRGPNIDPL